MTTWTSLDCEVTLENGILTVTGNGAMDNYSSSTQPWKDVAETITSIVIGSGVTKIGNCFAYGCKNVTTVTISDTVTYIGSSAFMKCESIKTITIPTSVTIIEQDCFSGCTGLETANVNANILELPINIFSGCIKLKNVTFSNNIDKILQNSFNGCTSLTNITLPTNLTKLAANVFNGCTSLETIVIPNSLTNIGSTCFKNTKIKSLKFGKNLTNISSYGLSNMGELQTLDMEDCLLQNFEVNAISNCTKLKTVILPNDVKTLSAYLFDGCTSLTEIIIPKSVKKIDYSAFNGTSLNKITFNGDYTQDLIDKSAFKNLTLELTYYTKKLGWETVLSNHNLGGATNVVYNGIEIKTINNIGLKHFYNRIKPMLDNDNLKYPTGSILRLSAKGCTTDSIKQDNGVKDVSGYGHHGKAYGGVTVLEGGKGFEFNNTSNTYIQTTPITINPEATITARIVANQSTKDTQLFVDGRIGASGNVDTTNAPSFWIVITTNSKITIAERKYQNFIDYDSDYGVIEANGKEYTITVTSSESENKLCLYINGVLHKSWNNHLILGGITRIIIGAYQISASTAWNGSISDFRIYPRALSASEVKTLYMFHDDAPFGQLTSDLIGANVIKANNLQSGSVVSDKIAAKAVTAEKLSVKSSNGENLLFGTEDFSGSWVNKALWTEDGTYNGLKVMTRTDTYMGICQRHIVEAGHKYTFSAFVKNTTDNLQIVIVYGEDPALAGCSPNAFFPGGIRDNFERVSATFTCTKSGVVECRIEMRTNTGSLSVCGYKLEEGEFATPWTPRLLTPNTTTIDGGKITANSITADKITVGSHVNLIETALDDFEQCPNNASYYGSAHVGTDPYIKIVSGEAYKGTKCLKMYNPPDSTGEITTIKLCFGKSGAGNQWLYLPNGLYCISGWAKCSGNGRWQIFGIANNSSGSNEQWYWIATNNLTTSWVRYARYITSNESTGNYWKFRFDNDFPGSTIWIDYVQIELVSSPGQAPSSWRKGSCTVIDGGNINANSITADKLADGAVTPASIGAAPSSHTHDYTPVGTVIFFAKATAPSGFIVCNGAAVSRTTYSALYSVIGTTYGAGDGSTTFNLPNLIDKFAMGKSEISSNISAGLPNITGRLGIVLDRGVIGQTGNAFYNDSNKTTAFLFSAFNTRIEAQFNAKRCSSIYGNSTTVQPPAVGLLPCIRYN